MTINETTIGIFLFLLTIISTLVGYIGTRMAASLESIDRHVKELTTKVAIHEERFKRLEDRILINEE